MAQLKPFRFIANCEGNNNEGGARKIVELAQSAEAAGFDTFAIPDHFDQNVAPFSALGVIAAQTEKIRLATSLLNLGWRHPTVIAREATTLDLLSKGRFELGVGIQYVKEDLEKVKFPIEDEITRAEKLAAALEVMDVLLRGQKLTTNNRFYQIEGLLGYPRPRQGPRPPLAVTAGDTSILGVAAKYADIISVITRTTSEGKLLLSDMTLERTLERINYIKNMAGERFSQIELSWTMVAVMYSENRIETAEMVKNAVNRGFQPNIEVDTQLSVDDILASPYLAIGTFEEIAEQIISIRAKTGMSYVGTFPGQMEALAPVIPLIKNQDFSG